MHVYYDKDTDRCQIPFTAETAQYTTQLQRFEGFAHRAFAGDEPA